NGSINYLSHLHNVTLRMDKTHIFDADLELLKPVSGSLLISLNQTNITDKGLMTLKSHPCLFYVSVKKTKVSEKGLRQFRKDMGWTELKDYSQELE
ncbi:MAG: hypothetical protein KDA65_19365, partial [Planctomycetaceae bacterium]|nr:hypothetical protein [Planctomycetaceae bacterium]